MKVPIPSFFKIRLRAFIIGLIVVFFFLGLAKRLLANECYYRSGSSTCYQYKMQLQEKYINSNYATDPSSMQCDPRLFSNLGFSHTLSYNIITVYYFNNITKSWVYGGAAQQYYSTTTREAYVSKAESLWGGGVDPNKKCCWDTDQDGTCDTCDPAPEDPNVNGDYQIIGKLLDGSSEFYCGTVYEIVGTEQTFEENSCLPDFLTIMEKVDNGPIYPGNKCNENCECVPVTPPEPDPTDTGDTTGGSTGSDTGSTTGGDSGSTTGGDTGSDTGSTTGGDSGSTTGGSTGSDTGSTTTGGTGSTTGGSTGGDTGSTTTGGTGSTTGGDTGSDTGSTTGGDSGSTTGGDTGSDTGSTTTGGTGSTTGGDTGTDTGSTTGGDSGSTTTGGDTGTDTGSTTGSGTGTGTGDGTEPEENPGPTVNGIATGNFDNPYTTEDYDLKKRFTTFLGNMRQSGVFALPQKFIDAIPNGGSPIIKVELGSYGSHTIDLSSLSKPLLILRSVLLLAFSWISIRVIILKR